MYVGTFNNYKSYTTVVSHLQKTLEDIQDLMAHDDIP